MEVSPENESALPSNNLKALISFYSDYLHKRLSSFFPLSVSSAESFLSTPQNGPAGRLAYPSLCRLPQLLLHSTHRLRMRKNLCIQSRVLLVDSLSVLFLFRAMLELDQILRANEINFAILAALPAFFLSLILAMFVRAWFKKDTRAEGGGRVARIQRRLCLMEIERAIMQFQRCQDQGLENDAQCMYGLVLCFLDSLHCAVERHAKETGEWICLRQDIIDLAKADLETAHKLNIASRMERVYECLLPPSKRHALL